MGNILTPMRKQLIPTLETKVDANCTKSIIVNVKVSANRLNWLLNNETGATEREI